MTDSTVLSADEHFDGLREAVWVRFAARHRGSLDRDRFEDLYAEWWTRETERAAKGTPSSAAVPAAFVAEAVHRVLIDEARARARGLGRGEKGSLDIVDLDEQRDAAGADDTAGAAAYEALAHRVLSLVRTALTERETRIFVWSFLYLQTSEATARALGLSVPRVKKDRKKIAGKIGAEVWKVLQGELDLCAVYSEHSLPAIFELLTVHVEDCPTCSAELGGMRRGALAAIGPEVLLLAAAEPTTHVFDDLLARIYGLMNRGTETLAALPPQGRTAAVVAVAATAVAGGAATVVPSEDRRPSRAETEVARATPTPRQAVPGTTAAGTPTSAPSEGATATPEPTVRAKVRTTAAKAPSPTATAAPSPRATSAPAPTAEGITFEQPAPAQEPVAAVAAEPDAPAPKSHEFGFEGP